MSDSHQHAAHKAAAENSRCEFRNLAVVSSACLVPIQPLKILDHIWLSDEGKCIGGLELLSELQSFVPEKLIA